MPTLSCIHPVQTLHASQQMLHTSMQAARAKAEEQAVGAKMDKKIAAAEELVADLKKKAAELQVCNLLQCLCMSETTCFACNDLSAIHYWATTAAGWEICHADIQTMPA